MKKIKVLFIWHAAVVKTYQKYIAELAENPNLDITLLIPQASIEGSKTIKAYKPEKAKYKVIVGHALAYKDPLISIYPALPYYLLKVKPDLIHLFEEPYHNLATYLFFWINLVCPKSKLLFQTFQNQIEDYRIPWIKTQNNIFHRSSTAIACSEEIKDVLLHWNYTKPIHVIYPGIETSQFYPKDATELREKLGLKTFTIGYFGRMVKEKGIEDLLAASDHLNMPHQLLMLGNGKDRDYFKGLTDKAIWVDAVDPEDVNHYYSALDVLALPSRTTKHWKEQFGRVLLEAMLCGTPVIGSSSGEIPNVIGNAGLIFNEKNSLELSDKIKQLYENPSLRNELANKGAIRAKQFDWKETAQKTYTVYQSIFPEVL